MRPLLLVTFVTAGMAACAGPRPGAVPPPDALTVATVRHTASPQAAPSWIDAAVLPPDAQRGDAGRALLLEATLRTDGSAALETAPLELANLIVRIERGDARETVVAIQNLGSAPIAFDLFLTQDGARYRVIPSCPVAGGSTAYERWPGAATGFAIGALRAAPASSPGCG